MLPMLGEYLEQDKDGYKSFHNEGESLMTLCIDAISEYPDKTNLLDIFEA